MKECEQLKWCAFFGKYQDSHFLICRDFIKNYCIGKMQENCERKKYKLQHGRPPSDDMMPNGEMVLPETE